MENLDTKPITLAMVQARTSSTRLPGKVLAPILDTPMIVWLLRRISRSQEIDKVVLVTSTDPSDDELAQCVEKEGHRVYRGSLQDVLERFYKAYLDFGAGAQAIVRLTGDCPLLDWQLLDEGVRLFKSAHCDYLSNAYEPSFPDGLDYSIFTPALLTEAHQEARLPSEREHVVPWMWKHSTFVDSKAKYQARNLRCERDLKHLRWTVDEPADLEMIRRVFEMLGPWAEFSDVLRLFESHPQWARLNAHIVRDEGYKKSLERDKED